MRKGYRKAKSVVHVLVAFVVGLGGFFGFGSHSTYTVSKGDSALKIPSAHADVPYGQGGYGGDGWGDGGDGGGGGSGGGGGGSWSADAFGGEAGWAGSFGAGWSSSGTGASYSGSGGGDGGGDCFSADTPVLMADGSEKPIATVEKDDLVASFEGLGNLLAHRVIERVEIAREPLLSIDGVRTTGTHPFLLADGTWKHAKDIEIGDSLVQADGSSHRVTNIVRDGWDRVFNLEVEGGDTFIAGGFRVHNSTIICLELYRQGFLSELEYAVERRWSRAYNPFSEDQSLGPSYYKIARPIIRLSRRSPRFARTVAAVIRPWIRELGYRHEGWAKGHLAGRFYIEVLVPVCRVLCGRPAFVRAS